MRESTSTSVLESSMNDDAEIRSALESLDRRLESEGRLVGEHLVEDGLLTSEELLRVRAERLDLPFLESLQDEKVEAALLSRLPLEYLLTQKILPLREEDGVLIAAVAAPHLIGRAQEFSVVFGLPVRVLLAPEGEIEAAIRRHYGVGGDRMMEALEDFGVDEGRSVKDLLDMANDAPIVRFVTSVLTQAVRERASDIHIEPYEHEMAVRLRIDGVLHDNPPVPKRLHPAVVSRVKVMAGLDIAERRLPQDGRILIRVLGREVDLRVSTLPTSHGERVVLRLLDRESVMIGMQDLGFDGENLRRFQNLIKAPHGIILVTGPTGSGKSTTLYSSLSHIKNDTLNILTIEDPVEYQMEGIGQIAVKPEIGLTFASGLRSILRQDPDVILVGEIRDEETARIAIQASLTGHLVLSTLHTNDAASAPTRLMDMNIEPYLIATSLIGILAQRLVRVICPQCKANLDPHAPERRALGLSPRDPAWFGRGCPACRGTGYRGRTGLYELVVVDDSTAELIQKGASALEINRLAHSRKMISLREDGLRKIAAGITTPAEVIRVTAESEEMS